MLAVNDINVYYGKSHVLQGVSFEVKEGEVIAYLGRNGAGKTTTMNSIMGLIHPSSGSITYKGEEIGQEEPFNIFKKGIGIVPEKRRIFSTLTVLENLSMVSPRPDANVQWDLDKVFALFPRLKEREKHRGNELSGGEQQMLSLARALMGNPDFLLLDEPTEGLAPTIIETIVETIHRIKDEGLSIVFVDQNPEVISDLVDRYIIIEEGKTVYSGETLTEELKVRYLSI